MIREELTEILERDKMDFEEMSDKVWDFAELCFKEIKSSEYQADYMRKRGFRVTMPVAKMPSAFIAEWGSGKPVIALLGENDALAGLSQEADVLEQKAIVEGGSGHGCGHNFLGTGAIEAACAVKEYMEKHKLSGTIRYYACPAEEGGGGKVYMVLDGQFEDVDSTLVWHPGTEWDITQQGMAIVSAFFKFEGIAAHAAGAYMGRSALDALELMNVGVQFLREHVKPETYMHYAITNAGGPAANVVQATAEGFYILRQADQKYLAEVFDRVCDIAKGAALMTGTKFLGPQIISAYAPIMSNKTLDEVQYGNLKACLPVPYTEEEIAYGKEFVKVGTTPEEEFPYATEATCGKGRTCSDVADVSWVTPLSYFHGVTTAKGTIGHGWGTVAQGKGKPAKRGMHTAAKVLANTALDLFENPEIVEKAKAEFAETMKDKEYKTLMENCSVENYRQ